MVKLFHRFLKDDYGGSSIQYAFIAVVIPVAFIVSVNCLESWFRKSAQDDKWSFCLTVGTLCPANQERR